MAWVSVSASNALPATTSAGSSSLFGALVEQPLGRLDALLLAQRRTHRVPLRLGEREHHRAADQDRVGHLQERVQHPDLVGHLGPADDGHQRPRRVGQDAGERLDLTLQQPPGRAGQQRRHPVRGGVGAVGGTERVVHEHVAQRRVPLRQLRVVVGLAGEEAHVLDHHHVAGRQRVGVGLDRPAPPPPPAARRAAPPRAPATARGRAPSAGPGGPAAPAAPPPSHAARAGWAARPRYGRRR